MSRHLTMLTGVSSSVSPYLLTTVIGAPVGITSSGISLVFLISNEIIKMFLKAMEKKKKKHEKIVLLTRSD